MTDEQVTPADRPHRKKLLFLIKLVLTVAMLYIVLSQADIGKIISYASDSNLLYLLLAFIARHLAQLCRTRHRVDHRIVRVRQHRMP